MTATAQAPAALDPRTLPRERCGREATVAHPPHVEHIGSWAYWCDGRAERITPDSSGGPCGCSDLLCPCTRKPGHGPFHPAPVHHSTTPEGA